MIDARNVSEATYRLYALYELRTGFCRRRESLKEQFNEIAACSSLDLLWGRDAYAGHALGALISKVGIFNGMFFKVASSGTGGGRLHAGLIRDAVTFMNETRQVEGWRRIYLYLSASADVDLDPQRIVVVLGQGLEIESLLLERLERGTPCIIDLDPGPPHSARGSA